MAFGLKTIWFLTSACKALFLIG